MRNSRLRPVALRQKGVEVAVAVVVEERRAGAHDLVHVVLAAGAIDVRERDRGWGVLEERRWLSSTRRDQQRSGAHEERESLLFQRRQIAIDGGGQIMSGRTAARAASLRIDHLMPSCFAARAQVRDAQGEQVARRFRISRLHDLLELGGGFVGLVKRDQHAREVESGEPEAWLTLNRLAIGIGGVGQLALPLERLSEVVLRLGVHAD